MKNLMIFAVVSFLCASTAHAFVTTNDPLYTNTLTPDGSGNVSWSVDRVPQSFGWTLNSWVWSTDVEAMSYDSTHDCLVTKIDMAQGGVVYKFQSTTGEPLALNIMVDYEFAFWAGRKITLYFSDENDWANLSPMTGSFWPGNPEFEILSTWKMLNTYQEWNGIGASPLTGTATSYDGTFYVRVDISSVSAIPQSTRLHNLTITGQPAVSVLPPKDTRTQVLKGNIVDFTPAVGTRDKLWTLGSSQWQGGNLATTEFDNQVYTYNDNYVCHNNKITTAWCVEGSAGIGGIVWHFKVADPCLVAAKGGMIIDQLSAAFSYALVSAGNSFEIYYSDENNWSSLSPMVGGVWVGPTWTGMETNANWNKVYSKRLWGGQGTYAPSISNADVALKVNNGNNLVTTDGDFWVRVDLNMWNEDLYFDQIDYGYNILDQVAISDLQVGGHYNFPTTCEEVQQDGKGMRADVNHDCKVDFNDFALIAAQWMQCFDCN